MAVCKAFQLFFEYTFPVMPGAIHEGTKPNQMKGGSGAGFAASRDENGI
jgi:hypothetical protein